ncbi:THAP domain-containing protein 9 [Trachymyrmex cornetzi]|uniref:THAP domain-containing protein 9 n=1 Tax=Trachymyrmex cornetzi TaxID=471704 RepID=A0A151JBV4_9HYME|nr:THAP domain-containing protein 9 [Trachymyrmex cornetzi]
MAIRKELLWDSSSRTFVCTCDYGNGLTLEDPDVLATDLLIFLLVELGGKWKWPIAYFLVNKSANANIQSELIKTALIKCSSVGVKTWSVTCDGAVVNYSTLNMLDTDLHNMKPTFKHPSSDCKVYFVPDACHNVKLARNAMSDRKVLCSPTGYIRFEYIEKLNILQQNMSLKIANKIGSAHIEWKKNAMKIKLAAQTLSSCVADGINVQQIQSITKKMLLKNSITASSAGNCLDLSSDSLSSVFELKWTRRRSHHLILLNITMIIQNYNKNNIEHNNDSTEYNDDNINFYNIVQDILNMRNYGTLHVNSAVTNIQDNVLYYICGFIVRKLFQNITCETCAESLLRNEDNKNVNYGALTNSKNRGGLFLVSDSVYKIVKATEHEFTVHGLMPNKMPHKKLFKNIIYKIKNQFALNYKIFSHSDKCMQAESIMEPPHRIKLIVAVAEKYLNIRCFSYQKFYTKEIANPISKRHRLNKTVLFSHM